MTAKTASGIKLGAIILGKTTQLLRMGTKMDENRDLLAKIMRESIAETREELREEIRTTNTLINAKK